MTAADHAQALAFFGDAAMAGSAAGTFDKGKRLAQLVGERRALADLKTVKSRGFGTWIFWRSAIIPSSGDRRPSSRSARFAWRMRRGRAGAGP